jgi:hypothetical protein
MVAITESRKGLMFMAAVSAGQSSDCVAGRRGFQLGMRWAGRGVMTTAALLCACGPNYKELKVDNIDTVAVVVDGPEQSFCGYKPVPLRAVVTYRNGKQAHSKVPGERQRGRLRVSEFRWSSTQGEIDGDAVLYLSHRVLEWLQQPVRVQAVVGKRPELGAESTLKPRFDCGGTLDFRGAIGARGGEGENAGPGGTGLEVEVALAYIDTETSGRLVLVRARTGDEDPEYYVVTPRSPAPLVIDARGGDGGRGGQGATGMPGQPGVDGRPGPDGPECGDGGPGEDGTPGGPGGPGGPAANGGNGGQGGSVVVRYDARFPELVDSIQVRVEGGDAGAAGRGGSGGRGGLGGKGGPGGKAGPGSGHPDCQPVDGPDGADGTTGPSGASGPDGQPGVAGPPGQVQSAEAEVSELFADELAHLPIVGASQGEARP